MPNEINIVIQSNAGSLPFLTQMLSSVGSKSVIEPELHQIDTDALSIEVPKEINTDDIKDVISEYNLHADKFQYVKSLSLQEVKQLDIKELSINFDFPETDISDIDLTSQYNNYTNNISLNRLFDGINKFSYRDYDYQQQKIDIIIPEISNITESEILLPEVKESRGYDININEIDNQTSYKIDTPEIKYDYKKSIDISNNFNSEIKEIVFPDIQEVSIRDIDYSPSQQILPDNRIIIPDQQKDVNYVPNIEGLEYGDIKFDFSVPEHEASILPIELKDLIFPELDLLLKGIEPNTVSNNYDIIQNDNIDNVDVVLRNLEDLNIKQINIGNLPNTSTNEILINQQLLSDDTNIVLPTSSLPNIKDINIIQEDYNFQTKKYEIPNIELGLNQLNLKHEIFEQIVPEIFLDALENTSISDIGISQQNINLETIPIETQQITFPEIKNIEDIEIIPTSSSDIDIESPKNIVMKDIQINYEQQRWKFNGTRIIGDIRESSSDKTGIGLVSAGISSGMASVAGME
jgi:hypothetical protein